MRAALLLLASFATLFALGFLLLGRRMATGRVGRLARIGRLSARLSASWFGATLRRTFAGPVRRARIDGDRRRADAARIAETMGHMKGAMMKLGQMVSFISDEVPAELRTALASLQAEAPPMDFPLIRDVIEHELGKPLERAFAAFDEKPLAAASIGQVHRAILPTGEAVAVKVQYPGVAEAMRADLDNAAFLYRAVALMFPALEPGPVVEELRGRLTEELDYAHEAQSQSHFAALYDGHPYIRIPRVIPGYSTARLLTSELVEGRRFAAVLADDPAARARWGEILYRFVFGSILHHAVFNGDPHPGNYLFDDTGRIVFLDFGCVKYFPAEMMGTWRSLAIAHMRSNVEQFRARAVELRFVPAGSDIDAQVLFDYFSHFYEPWRIDREFTFTRAYAGSSLRMVFAPDGPFAGLSKKLNMPRDFVFVNRIQWGVYSLLAQLEATANWHKIHHELLFDAAPSTELGRLDAEWRARRKEKDTIAR